MLMFGGWSELAANWRAILIQIRPVLYRWFLEANPSGLDEN